MSNQNIYKFTISPINESAEGRYFNDWLISNYEPLSISHNPDGVLVSFDGEPDQSVKDVILSKYQSLTVENASYEYEIKKQYGGFKKDGEDFFDDIRADLVLSYKLGQRTASDIYEIESRFEAVISKMLRGDWMTCANEMQNVTVSGAIDQDLYDRINNYVNQYIIDNYS